MAEQNVSDLIMKFVGDDGKPIDGETLTEIDLRKCELSTGFIKGKMFELQSFTFKTGLGGEDQDEVAKKQQDHSEKLQKGVEDTLKKHAEKLGIPYEDLKMPKSPGFKDFRENKNSTAKYPVDMKPMEFSRSVDLTSPILLDYCIKRRIFKSASLIKRKAAGSASSGEIFLRFDFKTVLISKIDWDNDEPIKETCEFVCRAVTINYLPQLPDGTLGASIHAYWTSVKDLPEDPLS